MMSFFGAGALKATRAAAEAAAKLADAEGEKLREAIEKNRQIAEQAVHSCEATKHDRKFCRA